MIPSSETTKIEKEDTKGTNKVENELLIQWKNNKNQQ